MVTKSCTRQGNYERYLWNTVNNGKTHLPTGAGFLPSAVWRWICKRHILSFGEHMIKLMGFPSISSLMFTGLHSLVRTSLPSWRGYRVRDCKLVHCCIFFFEAGIVRIDSPMSEILPASCCQYHLSWYCMFVQNATQTWCVPRATRTVLNDFDSLQKKRDITHTHMLHVWNIYQHLPHKWPSFVGKYTIHGAYGIDEWHGGKKPHIWP